MPCVYPAKNHLVNLIVIKELEYLKFLRKQGLMFGLVSQTKKKKMAITLVQAKVFFTLILYFFLAQSTKVKEKAKTSIDPAN